MPIISTTDSHKEVELSDKLKKTHDTIEMIELRIASAESAIEDNVETMASMMRSASSKNKLFQILLSQHKVVEAKVDKMEKAQKRHEEAARKEQVMSVVGILGGCGLFYFNEALGLITIVATSVLINLLKLPNKL